MIGCDWMVEYRETDSRSSYVIGSVGISRASDVSLCSKFLATRKLEMSSASLTIVFAPTLALLAHSLQAMSVVSVVCQGARGVNILLVFSEAPETLGYCVDGDPIGVRNGLKGYQHATSKWTQIVPQLP